MLRLQVTLDEQQEALSTRIIALQHKSAHESWRMSRFGGYSVGFLAGLATCNQRPSSCRSHSRFSLFSCTHHRSWTKHVATTVLPGTTGLLQFTRASIVTLQFKSLTHAPTPSPPANGAQRPPTGPQREPPPVACHLCLRIVLHIVPPQPKSVKQRPSPSRIQQLLYLVEVPLV